MSLLFTTILLTDGAFVPLSSEQELITFSEITVNQLCIDQDACRGDVLPKCEENGVCHPIHTCHGRENFPDVKYPVSSWIFGPQEGCLMVSDNSERDLPTSLTTHDSDQILIVNGSKECFLDSNGTVAEDVFSVVFWLRASCDKNW